VVKVGTATWSALPHWNAPRTRAFRTPSDEKPLSPQSGLLFLPRFPSERAPPLRRHAPLPVAELRRSDSRHYFSSRCNLYSITKGQEAIRRLAGPCALASLLGFDEPFQAALIE
jgi:hypothetical protein